jgi:hypothetical protein
MSSKALIIFCLFIISRIFFINYQPVFFDSPEYLTRLSDPNFIHAITTGHAPFHAGYIALFWPIFNLFKILNINPPFAIICIQIMFSAFALFCFYRFLTMFANNMIAEITSIIFSLTPLYWITNETIMTESTCVNFFLISLLFMAKYARIDRNLKIFLLCGCLLFGLALLTNPLVILWTPFLFSIIYFLKKERLKLFSIALTISIVSVIFINSFLISYSFQIPIFNGIYQYLFGTDIKITPTISSYVDILRFIRNAFIPILQNNTGIVLIIGIVSVFKVFKINKKLFIISILLILPAIIINQWYDPLLYGRHSVISGLGFCLLAAIFLEHRKILYYIVILYLLITSIPALYLLRQPIPYIQMSEFAAKLPKGLLIETHFARPQIEGHYLGKIEYVNQPGWNQEKLKNTINNYLKNNEKIFITSQALSEPYGTYSGPFLYPLSLSYMKNFELNSLMISYQVIESAKISTNSNLILYMIISKNMSKYPNIPALKYDRRRLDYFDPLIQLWFLIDKARIIQSHNIING